MITELNLYQQEVIKTRKPMELPDLNKYTSAKIIEEAAEVLSIVSKHYYHGKGFNKEHLKEELGDLFYYLASMSEANGFTLSEIATFNIEKLRKRHGESYNPSFYKT